MKALLPLLLVVLICPIVMVVMMRGMHGHGARTDTENGVTADKNMSAVELRKLRQDLEQRVDELDARLEDLETSGAATADDRTIRT
jgi:hypothetical protein